MQFESVKRTKLKENADMISWEDKTLCQDEIDVLVQIACEERKQFGEVTFKTTLSDDDAVNFTYYDFWRPQKFSKLQLKDISIIFETVARKATTYYSKLLFKNVHIHVACVDMITIQEFQETLKSPAKFISAKWSENPIFVAWDPEIAYKTVCLGITDENLKTESQNLFTSLQKEYFRVCWEKSFFDILKDSFSYTRSIKYISNEAMEDLGNADNFEVIEDSAYLKSQIENESIVLITFECSIEGTEGFINVCLPESFINNILIKKGVIMSKKKNMQDFSLEVVPGNSTVSLGEFNMPEGEVLDEGTIIPLNTIAGEPINLVDKKTGKVFAKADVIVVDDKFAVKITEVL